jgi:hypothetical protein
MSKLRSIGLVLAVVVLASAYFVPLHLQAQVGHGSRGSGGGGSAQASSVANSDTLPATCTQADVYHDNNATSGARFSICDSTDTWVTPLTAETQTLDQAFDLGKLIDGANSEANCFRVGTAANYYCIYSDAGTGLYVKPEPLADTTFRAWTNFNLVFRDEESAAAIETIDPDAASTLAMWTYGTAYRPKKSIWLDAGAASVDGTQCATPTESANTLVKTWTIVCQDSDSGAIYWKFTMPDSWDGGTITAELAVYQVGAGTNTIELDIAAMCYSHDEAVSAFATPPTGEQAASITLTADNDILHSTTAAITPAGTTCAGGDTLFVTAQVDATASHADIAVDAEIMGVKVEYSITSRSD